MRAWLLAIVICLLTANSRLGAQGNPPATPPAEPVPSLTGRVEQVYLTERQPGENASDVLFALEVRLTEVTRVAGARPGERVFIKAWKPRPPPDPKNAAGDPLVIPDVGDVARFRVNPARTPFEVEDRQGIDILLPGTLRSESIGLRLRLLEAGEFVMGSQPKEAHAQGDETGHRVRLSRPFYLGVYEVTQFEFQQVLQRKPSAFAVGGGSRDKVSKVVTDRFPVENVSWFDAVEFCNALSRKDGLPPYYQISPPDPAAAPETEPLVAVLGGTGYRLPTEAEWEYACRASTLTPFHFGMRGGLKLANCQAAVSTGGYGASLEWKSLGRTTKVGSYPANAWGLFDMHGNVAEWCGDWYGEYLAAKENPPEVTVDPQGPAQGTHRVLRGGSWLLQDRQSRSASRMFHAPREQKYYGGFRVARSPAP